MKFSQLNNVRPRRRICYVTYRLTDGHSLLLLKMSSLTDRISRSYCLSRQSATVGKQNDVAIFQSPAAPLSNVNRWHCLISPLYQLAQRRSVTDRRSIISWMWPGRTSWSGWADFFWLSNQKSYWGRVRGIQSVFVGNLGRGILPHPGQWAASVLVTWTLVINQRRVTQPHPRLAGISIRLRTQIKIVEVAYSICYMIYGLWLWPSKKRLACSMSNCQIVN